MLRNIQSYSSKRYNRHGMENSFIKCLFFLKIENKYKKKIIFNQDILKIFSSISDQNNWIVASKKPLLKAFLDSKIYTKKIKGIKTEFGYGVVNKCGRISTLNMINGFKNKFKNNFLYEDFDFKKLSSHDKKLFITILFPKILFSARVMVSPIIRFLKIYQLPVLKVNF